MTEPDQAVRVEPPPGIPAEGAFGVKSWQIIPEVSYTTMAGIRLLLKPMALQPYGLACS